MHLVIHVVVFYSQYKPVFSCRGKKYMFYCKTGKQGIGCHDNQDVLVLCVFSAVPTNSLEIPNLRVLLPNTKRLKITSTLFDHSLKPTNFILSLKNFFFFTRTRQNTFKKRLMLSWIFALFADFLKIKNALFNYFKMRL